MNASLASCWFASCWFHSVVNDSSGDGDGLVHSRLRGLRDRLPRGSTRICSWRTDRDAHASALHASGPGNYLLRPSRLSRQPILSFNTAGTWGLVAFDAFDAIDASLFSASTRCCTRVVTPNPSFIFPVHLHRPTSGGRTFDAFDALDTLDAYPEAPYHLFADVTVFPGGSGDLADPFLFSLPITVSVHLLGAGGRHATSCVTS